MTVTSNNACSLSSPATATFSVIVTQTTASAGYDITTCSNSGTVTDITAGASAANYSAIQWSGGTVASWTNRNNLTLATYTPTAADIAAGSVTITLTAFNAICGNAVSTKTLTITHAATATAGGPNTVCQSPTLLQLSHSVEQVSEEVPLQEHGRLLQVEDH